MTTGFDGQKILLCSSSYPFDRSDFHARFVHEMAVALMRCGASVHVLTPAPSASAPETEVWEGVCVERLRFFGIGWESLRPGGGDGLWENIWRRPSRTLGLPGYLGSFVRAIHRRMMLMRPDVVVSHWLVPTGLAVALAARGTQARVSHVAHGSDVHLLNRIPAGRPLVRSIARGGRVVVTSAYLGRRLQALVPELHCPIVPSGVTLGEVPARAAPRPDALRLCYLGRLVPRKGLDRLLEVADCLPGATVSIAGGGGDLECLRARTADRPRVILTGPRLGEAKRAFFAEQDFFLFVPDPVSEEAFQDNLPVSVLEAMACGLPVVATRVGALPELLTGELAQGLVPGHPGVIAERLRGLVKDHASLRAAARRVAEGFSWERQLSRLGAVLWPEGRVP